MAKDIGIASDGNFSSTKKLIQPFPVIFYGRKWRAALRGQANPANWPISGKIAKMALFNPCMEFKIFLHQITSLVSALEVPPSFWIHTMNLMYFYQL